MQYRLLGLLQVVHDERPVDIGPPKQRAVLAALLLARGRVVSTDRLIDAVWGDDAPERSIANLQVYISNLRRLIRPGAGAASPIVRRALGYYLDVDAEQIDLAVFEQRCLAARAAAGSGDWTAALSAAEAALELWGGPLLEDMRDEDWVRQDAVRVDDMHAECVEHHVASLLAVGRVADALAEVSSLRVADAFRERGCWLQMLALYRAGRGPEALDVFARHTRVLAGELGLDPGPELRDLESAILRQAPELAAWPRAPGWTGALGVSVPTSEPTPGPPVSPPERRTKLVGRDREFAVITTLLDVGVADATRWLVLTGPPGIGKTRLAEEAVARVSAAGGQVVWVSCPDERGVPPWWPMRQLVRAVGADAEEVLQVASDTDPDTARFRVYERIQALLETSSSRPLTVVIDDAQWADSTSVNCLAYLAGALRGHAVAFIVTVRDGELPPEVYRLMAAVARGVHNRRIEVPALGPEDVAALANQVADEVVADAEAAVLAVRTGGNPFFVCEYARLPREVRARSEIPVAVRAVLNRRLAGLDTAVLQVLRAAAVIGDTVDAVMLAHITGLDLDTLAVHLDEAADHRILVCANDSDAYVFAHGLLRDELIASIPSLRRQRLHAEIAEALAESTAVDALTRRAQHMVAALPLVAPAQVVEACRLAAEQATQRWSSDIAAQWWQAALDAFELLPASARTDFHRDALTMARLEALSRAGRGLTVLNIVEKNLEDALRTQRAATAGRMASALLRATGAWAWLEPGVETGVLSALLRRAATLAAGQTAVEARIHAALAVGQCYHPDPTVAQDSLSRAMQLAEETGDPDIIADALLGHLVTYTGVATHSQQTLGWVDHLVGLKHSRGREDSVLAHSFAAMAAMNLADVDSARRHLLAGIHGSEDLHLAVIRTQLRWMEAVLAMWRGDFAAARRHHEIAAQVHEQTELYEAGTGLVAQASLRRETGEPVNEGWLDHVGVSDVDAMADVVQVAVQTMKTGPDAAESAAAMLARMPTGPMHVWTTLGQVTLQAHLCADHGLTEFAPHLLQTLEPFRNYLALIGQAGIVGPVALATARLHTCLGHRDTALEHVAHAESIAERTGGWPSLQRSRLLACELRTYGPDVVASALRIEMDAKRLGMRGVAEAAGRLARRNTSR